MEFPFLASKVPSDEDSMTESRKQKREERSRNGGCSADGWDLAGITFLQGTRWTDINSVCTREFGPFRQLSTQGRAAINSGQGSLQPRTGQPSTRDRAAFFSLWSDRHLQGCVSGWLPHSGRFLGLPMSPSSYFFTSHLIPNDTTRAFSFKQPKKQPAVFS